MTTHRLLTRLRLIFVLTALVTISCNLQSATSPPTSQPTVLAPSTAQPTGPTAQPIDTTAPPTSVKPTSEHRIGVRVVNGVGEFYDRVSGDRFVPRGNNYIRLAQQHEASGQSTFYHSTFNSDTYSPEAIDRALSQMQRGGYNVVRVFLNHCCTTGMSGSGGELSSKYLDNVTDFLRRAKARSIYVMFALDWLPEGKYTDLIGQACCQTFDAMNVHILSAKGVEANRLFFKDFIRGLIARNAPLDAILAYSLRNELSFDSNAPPLSFTSGKVTTANGKTYDMALAKDRQRMMDEGLVYWIDNVRQAILEVDPTALVTVGFFQPQTPHPTRIGDPRVIETRPAIWDSSADFIDLHAYAGSELSLKEYVDNYKIDGMQQKPIVMGEFGAPQSSYSSIKAAAQALHDWQVASCQLGFDGWLMWTWDTTEQSDFFNALSDDGTINQVLSPANRSNPCQAGSFDFFEKNVALGKTVRASRALPDQPPSNAVDGTLAQWGAGDFAPQWIEIDLGAPTTIKAIRLTIAQSPTGETLHQIWGRGSNDKLRLLHEFHGTTDDNQVLDFTPDKPIDGIQFVRVVTTQSPSWIAWKEITVIAP